MSQLNDFSGGLSTRVHPGYVGLTEGVEYTNIDPGRLTLKSMYANRLEEATNKSHLYIFKGNKILTNDKRDYVELSRKLYFTDGKGRPQKSVDGLEFFNLGIEKRDEAPVIAEAGAGVVTGTVQYCYTYYNEKDGTESQPTPYSDELAVSNKSVVVSYYNSTDPQVTHIRFYRIGGTLLDMFMVAEIANDVSLVVTQYTDNTPDIEATRIKLSSQTYAPAMEGLQYLTEADATLFAAKADKLYFTDIGAPNYWSEFNYILIDDTITGISDSALGLLVFTKFKTYLVAYGGTVGVMKTLLSGSQGCVSHNSIQYVNNLVVWVSTDGICMTNNGEITLVSQGKLGYLDIKEVKASIVHDEVYYVSLEDRTLAMDTRYGNIIFRNIDIVPSSLCIFEDEVYFIASGFIQVLEGDKNHYALMKFRSGNISESGLTLLKVYKNYYVRVEGELTIRLFLDDELLTETIVAEGVHEIRTPGNDRYAYHFSFEVEGRGELVELEYKVEVRQNGR